MEGEGKPIKVKLKTKNGRSFSEKTKENCRPSKSVLAPDSFRSEFLHTELIR